MTSTSAIGTKLCAMYGKRVTNADFAAMVQRRTVPEVATYLKTTTHFASCLTNMQENSIHRGQLEMLLGRQLFDEVMRLKRYDRSGMMFTLYFTQLELEQIISCISFLREGHQDQFIVNVPGYLFGKLQIDLDALVRIRTEQELLHALAHTRYAKPLARLLAEYQNHLPAVSICAARLTASCYQTLLKQVDLEYTGATRQALHDLLLMRIELQNLCIAFRMKKYFHASPERLQQSLIPLYHTLRRRTVAHLAEAPDAQTLLARLQTTRIGKVLNNDTSDFIEYDADCYRLKKCRKAFDFATDPAVRFVSFLTLRELELQNILTVIEGVRYNVPPDKITKLLIFAAE